MSQNDKILEMLKLGPVAYFDALDQADSTRLAARIKNLRDRGYDIYTETVRANGKRFALYHLNQKETA